MQALTKWRKVSAAHDPAAYLHTMLTNLFLGRARKRSYTEVTTDIEVPATVDPWPGIELELQVDKGLGVLAPAERAVVVARYMDDLPVAEVANRLGREESWVRVTAYRALKKMRVELEDRDFTEENSARVAPSRRNGHPWGTPRRKRGHRRATFEGEVA